MSPCFTPDFLACLWAVVLQLCFLGRLGSLSGRINSLLPERIQTQRLILRPLDNTDADDVLEYQSHSEVTQFVPWRPRTNEEGKPAAIIRKTSTFERKGDVLGVGRELQAENKVIGQIFSRSPRRKSAQQISGG